MTFYINKTRIIFEYSFLLVIAFALLIKNNSVIYVILFSSLHEAAHLITLLFFKGDIKTIRIAFYGVGLEYKCNFSFFEELLFLFAGIAINSALALLSIHREINYSLAIINLLPLYPLDGGRAVKLILNRLLNLNVSDFVYKLISLAVIAALIAYCVFTKNIQLVLIIVYILVFSLNNSFD